MTANNTPNSYGTITKIFHWLTALLILTIIPLGVIANRLPFDTNEQLTFKAQLFSYHKTLGVIIFAVALGRILWALTQTKPGSLHPDRKGEERLAEIVHWLLYISLVAVPLTGWIHHAATTGFAPILLPIGQELPLVPKNEAISDTFAALHWIWSKIMVGSILLHVAGAFKHLLIDRDQTLQRMWFGKHEPAAAALRDSNWFAPIAAIGLYALATGAGAAAGMFSHTETENTAPTLASVASDWVVEDGDITITVTQLGSPVTGSFGEWTSAINFDPQGTGILGQVTTTIAIGSMTLGSVTDQAMGADFFNAGAFPTALFQADISQAETGYVAEGTLTIKDIAAPVTLPFDLEIVDDLATMSGSLELDRRAFSIGDNMANETNLGFAVTVNVALAATRATP